MEEQVSKHGGAFMVALRFVVRALADAARWASRRLAAPFNPPLREAGMTTAEYAVGTIAACAFAAILYQVVTGDSVISALGDLISRALASI